MDPQNPPQGPGPQYTPPSQYSPVPPQYTPSTDPASAGGQPVRVRRGMAIVMIAVIAGVAIAGVAAALVFLRGSGDVLAKVTPATASVYATAYLDPPGAQKINANNLLSKFPDTSSDQKRDDLINKWLDQALKSTTLSHADVRAWMGSQVAFSAPADVSSGFSGSGGGALPGFSVMVVSKDDTKADASMTTVRTSDKAYTWSSAEREGVTTWIGSVGGRVQVVYALVNHILVFTSTTGYMADIVDTAKGKKSSLADAANFKNVQSKLSKDNLAFLYVDVANLVKPLARTLLGQTTSPQANDALKSLDAITGFGMAVSAQSDGLEVDSTVLFDTSKLTNEQKASLANPTTANSTLGFMPTGSYGFFTLSHIQQLIKSALATAKSSDVSGSDKTITDLGLDDPNGIVSHLTGDIGAEAAPDASSKDNAGAAVMIGTDDEDAMRSYITALPGKVDCGKDEGGCPSTTTTYKNVVITTITDPNNATVKPSWAVFNHMAVIGTSVESVKAVIDTGGSGGVTGTDSYKGASSHVDSPNQAEIYIDIPAVARAARAAMSATARQDYDDTTAPYIDHLGALVVSASSSGDASTMKLFLQIH